MITGYGATIVDGAWLTLQLALLSMLLAIVLGLLGAAFRLSPVRWLAWCGDLYATVVRGIPDLVLILLIFYGGQGLLNWVAPQLGYDDYIDPESLRVRASAPRLHLRRLSLGDLPRRLHGDSRGRVRPATPTA